MNGMNISDHFVGANKMVENKTGARGTRKQTTF